jgi:fatty-acyl-CoA synthase
MSVSSPNSPPESAARPDISAARTWVRALELAATIPRNPDRLLSDVIEEVAARCGDAPALLSDRECLSYRGLVERSNKYARWALQHGLQKGEVVCLLMTNRPEYFAAWLGITSVGGVVALLNNNLVGPSLAHCIDVVQPRHLIVASEFIDAVAAARASLSTAPVIWTHGADHSIFPRVDVEVQRQNVRQLSREDRPALTIEDRALYIYTSGTTGLPKAASVSHARVLQWSYWFAGMMGAQPDDRIYNCLPMYHSIGGVLVPGAMLVAGGSAVIRERFSVTHFWSDVLRWDCTLFQYIGEFCRYLLHAAPSGNHQGHRIRLACGNGLAADVWEEFKARFEIPRILEFYAATEGGVSLFNVEGKRGSMGRVPLYLAHRFSPALVRFDVESGMPVRDEQGLCIPCAPNEIGEALGSVVDAPSNLGSRFEGYTDRQATDSKILRDVFKPGDIWIRTGDLMRKDEQGFFYFVDRIGDTFRWKGENVATSEVAEAICACPGVQYANVYGVSVPGGDGRVGMALLVVEPRLSLAELRSHLRSRLPAYARPLFLRVARDIELTGSFRYRKTDLVRQGYNPSATPDALYFDDPNSQQYLQLDRETYEKIQAGAIRL